jgi:nucleotide-binding universal stress UspA family protein
MLKALVPVDDSPSALCAVRHVISLIQERGPIEVHLLNVQPPLRGDVSAVVPARAVHDYHLDEGRKALEPACELLDGAGVHYTRHIYVGHAAQVIAACAEELRCGEVIMGTHGYGRLTHLLMGSVSQDAIHQMSPRIPVTLVKSP